MPTELLIAPPASGKTETCIHRIQNIRESQSLSKIWVIVPDRKKAAYFRDRLAGSGGEMGVVIGTFRDIYIDMLESNGIFTPVVTPALEHRLVKETIDVAFSNKELTHYAPIQQKPGFIRALQDCFAELRGALVRPERFLEYTRNAAPARRELALLYDRFLSSLDQLKWIDQEGQSWLAISLLEGNPKAGADIHLMIVDGFTSFTGARRHFLKLLAGQAGGMLITLPGRLGSSRQVHRHSLAAIESLQQELSPQLTELSSSPRLPKAIQNLEEHFLDPGEQKPLEVPSPILIEAKSQSEEAREALRWIKALNKRENLPLKDCAVFVSNLDSYQPLLRSAANEFGVPVHFTGPDPLLESPAVIALLNLLSLPGEDFPTRTLFNTLRSPYFDFGLDSKALEDLEKVSQQAIIVMGREQWDDAWKMLIKAASALSEELDEERHRDNLTAGIDLPALQARFEAFWHLFNSITQVCSQSDWVAWLETLLEDLHFYEKLSSERDQEACKSLGDALKALVLSESVAGVRNVDYSQFLSDLQGALAGMKLDEPREIRRNALLVGGMVEARGTRYKAVALLGLSEGLFPVVENPDPFLDEELRRDLGLEPRLQREQPSIFYRGFTRADTNLLITRPYLSEDGEAWEPSPYWLAAKRLFTEKTVRKIHPNAAWPQADAASPQELLFWGVQQDHLHYQQDPELTSRWQKLNQARRILSMRRSKRAYGEFDGIVEKISAILKEKYTPQRGWSASRLEDYGTCPYKFYVNSVLKLAAKESPELGLDAAQLGTVYHRILEMVYRNAETAADTGQLLASLEDIAASVFQKAPSTYGFRPSPLWEVEKVQFLNVLRKTIEGLAEISAGWKPILFEQKFGIQDTPVLQIDLGAEQIQLHGVIDRVDQNGAGEIRVVDYKTGGSNLEKTDLLSGRRLQLPIYALAARDALRLGEVVDGFYWKIYEAKASSFKLEKFKDEGLAGPPAAYRIVIEHINNILSGIRSGRFPPKPPRGGCPEYCPAVQWCWRYQGGF